MRYFSCQLTCRLTFKQLCYFHCLLIFLFLFQFGITNKYPKLNKFIRLIAFVTKQLLKHTDSKLNKQSGLGKTIPQKLLTRKKIIPTRRDLTCDEVRPHFGGMNPFSNKHLSRLPGWMIILI